MNLVKINSINLWDEEWEIINSMFYSKNYIPVTPNSTLYFLLPEYEQEQPYLYVYCYDANKNAIANIGAKYNGSTSVVANDCHYIKFRTKSSYGTTYNHDIQICLNSCADKTTYHPHWVLGLDGQGKAFTADISSMLPSGIGVVDLGSLNWLYDATDACFEYFSNGSPLYIEEVDYNKQPYFICSKYLPLAFSGWGNVSDNTMGFSNTHWLYVKDTSFNGNATAFKNANKGVLLFYKKTI